jgi:hypothetical protein
MIEPHVSDATAGSRQQAGMTTIKRSAMEIVRAAIRLPTSLVGLGAKLVSGGPRRLGRMLHAGTGILLGALSLLAVGLEVFFVVRGVLYGVVDQGPYTRSWGADARRGVARAFRDRSALCGCGARPSLVHRPLHHRLGPRWLRGERGRTAGIRPA